MIIEIIFDIETQKLFNEIGSNDPADLGVSIVSVYRREVNEFQKEVSGKMFSFWESELSGMWDLFKTANRIIGFNSNHFDVPALKRLAPEGFTKLPHFDIMDHVRNKLGFNLSLSTLAKNTLGQDKSDVGTNAVKYWKSQDPAQLETLKKYCEMDVLITRDLYDFGVANKYLKYLDRWNNLQSFDVDFSYPKVVIDATRQIGLF